MAEQGARNGRVKVEAADALLAAIRRVNELRAVGDVEAVDVSVALLEALDRLLALPAGGESARRGASPSGEETRTALSSLEGAAGSSGELGSFLNPLLAELVEAILDYPSGRLAVYGSLAPGKANHGQLADLPGEWIDGYVRGILRATGWGADLGYPGFVWDPAAERVRVRVFRSPVLSSQWARLDAFEGESYSRILVPVGGIGPVPCVCNLYSVRKTGSDD